MFAAVFELKTISSQSCYVTVVTFAWKRCDFCWQPKHLEVVKSLYRYPVKSCLGEDLQRAELVQEGILGDRSHVVTWRKELSQQDVKQTESCCDFLTFMLLIQTSGWDVDLRFVTKVALGGRALTQREAPHLSMLAARINGKTLQMATELLDDTLKAPCPQPMSTEAKYGKLKGRLEHNSGTHLWLYGKEFDEWRCRLEVLCPFFTWNIQWVAGVCPKTWQIDWWHDLTLVDSSRAINEHKKKWFDQIESNWHGSWSGIFSFKIVQFEDFYSMHLNNIPIHFILCSICCVMLRCL